LAAEIAALPSNEVVFITSVLRGSIPGVTKVVYAIRAEAAALAAHIRTLQYAVRRAEAVALAAKQLKAAGFIPDIIVAHPGWGDSLYIKQVFFERPLVIYAEYYYSMQGADIGFDPEFPPMPEQFLAVRSQNAIDLLSLEDCDRGISPTHWQKSRLPARYRDKICTVFDGIDTSLCVPRPDVEFRLKDGSLYRASDEIVTFAARNLEPYRGFHIFVRAMEEICRRRPRTRFLIVGGDGNNYSQRLPEGQTYRQKYLIGSAVDMTRIHFLGTLPFEEYLRVLSVSSVHIYLTYPFVLSWSLLEAMSCGCLIVASATPPVREVISDRENGLLVDFFSPKDIADRVDEVLEDRARFQTLRSNARLTVQSQYELKTVCLPRQFAMLRDVIAKNTG
jgi:glycosyltransferase involved in cell wall biosynthesis